jgi:hypothetical protein
MAKKINLFLLFIAIGLFAVASIQNLMVLGRIWHILVLAWKVGWDNTLITAGSSMLWVFFTCSLISIFFAVGAHRYSTKNIDNEIISKLLFCSIVMLTGGCATWIMLIISPLVVIVVR